MAAGAANLAGLREDLAAWLAREDEALAEYRLPEPDLGTRVRRGLGLQRALWEAGWARHGWPADLGGSGGDLRHRCVLHDELAAAGFPVPTALEHLEILAPAVERFAAAAAVREPLARLLAGEELWCQGFSEPEAGSDLAGLRTTAREDGEELVVRGHKVWTSWATLASRCLLLVRTGSRESRHRGLTALLCDLDSPGVEVRGIEQANGEEELAEVTLDDVRVPRERMIGELGEGWAVAMEILECERASFAWLRQAYLFQPLERLAAAPGGEARDAALGSAAVSLLAARASARADVRAMAAGSHPAGRAAASKMLLTDAEQEIYELLGEAEAQSLHLGLEQGPEVERLRQEAGFARAVSIYGGTRQIQLETISRQVLGMQT